VLVVFLVFFIAKLTTIHLKNLESDFLFRVPHWLYVSPTKQCERVYVTENSIFAHAV